MLIKINKSHNYEFGWALLASTKWLRIPQTAFPRMLEDTVKCSGEKGSCGKTGMRNVRVAPSPQAPQYISRSYATRSLFKFT